VCVCVCVCVFLYPNNTFWTDGTKLSHGHHFQHLKLILLFYGAYQENLVALGGESCSSCREPVSDSCVPVSQLTHCILAVCQRFRGTSAPMMKAVCSSQTLAVSQNTIRPNHTEDYLYLSFLPRTFERTDWTMFRRCLVCEKRSFWISQNRISKVEVPC
jgi:hypothetical protein